MATSSADINPAPDKDRSDLLDRPDENKVSSGSPTSQRWEEAATGIRVNAVCPGPVESRIVGSLEDGLVGMLGLADAATTHLAVASTIPEGRYAKAEDSPSSLPIF